MNFKNSETSDPHRLLLNLSEKKTEKEVINMLLCQIVALTIQGKNIKRSYKKNKFQISDPTWKEKLNNLNRSYSVSDIQDY